MTGMTFKFYGASHAYIYKGKVLDTLKPGSYLMEIKEIVQQPNTCIKHLVGEVVTVSYQQLIQTTQP